MPAFARRAPFAALALVTFTLAACGTDDTVRGRAFEPDSATLDGSILTLRQGDDFFADRSVKVFLFDDTVFRGNRTWEVDGEGYGFPHVHLAYRDEGDSLPDGEIVMNEYRMTLAFGEPKADGVPFTIDLSVDGAEPTRVTGKHFAEFGDDVGSVAMSPDGATNDSDWTHLGGVSRQEIEEELDRAMLEMVEQMDAAAAEAGF